MKNDKNDSNLYQKYEDVLGNDADSDLVSIVSALDAFSTESEPPTHVVNSIRIVLDARAHEKVSHYEQKHQVKRARSGLSIAGLGLAAGSALRRFRTLPRGIAFILAAFVLIGATYSIMSVIDRAFYMDESTVPIIVQKMGREINQARSIDGFTVSVKRVYADSDQIVIGYTISGPPGRKFNTFTAWGEFDESPDHQVATLPILINEGGERLGAIGSISNGDVSGVYATGVLDGEYGQVLKYRAPSFPDDSKEIWLHFEVGTITAYEQLGESKFESITITGPFIFEFTVPIEPCCLKTQPNLWKTRVDLTFELK